MSKGRVEQIDTPTVVYDRPKSLFVNRFIGHANQVAGTIEYVEDNRTAIKLVTGDTLTLPRRLNFLSGADVAVTCRPEDVSLSLDRGSNTITAEVSASIPLGPLLVHHLSVGQGEDWQVTAMRDRATVAPYPGQHLHVRIDVTRCHVFPVPGPSAR
jgi:putative spermidine/putrescine transport system ATP-binding protein